MAEALVIGGGPAGLMAAEMLSGAGHAVTLADRMPSLGRKFLMAGKSGLNLTKIEEAERFRAAFHPYPPALAAAVEDFGPEEVMGWAAGLGQALFTGSTGRVFPTVMKASPLLRAWLARLDAQGVTVRTRWRWIGFDGDASVFETPQGRQEVTAAATVLAFGGGSWARLGSDGAWATAFPGSTVPFAPANMGLEVDWSPHMARFFGQPVKATALKAGNEVSRGEWVVSARGIEGGGIYALSRPIREGAPLTVDLVPDRSLDELRAALAKPRGKASLGNWLRKAAKLDPLRIALLQEFGRPLPDDLAQLLKALPIRHAGPRPLDEAISTAGGLRFDALTEDLMLTARPGTFAAGEMLDWEAPTGGYLLTASLATGRAAGLAAARYLG